MNNDNYCFTSLYEIQTPITGEIIQAKLSFSNNLPWRVLLDGVFGFLKAKNGTVVYSDRECKIVGFKIIKRIDKQSNSN